MSGARGARRERLHTPRGVIIRCARPLPNDPSVLEAVAAGSCDLGIANSYYLPRLQRRGGGSGLALFWPDQRDAGVHVNVFGGGVARHAPNSVQALDLLEWLSRRLRTSRPAW